MNTWKRPPLLPAIKQATIVVSLLGLVTLIISCAGSPAGKPAKNSAATAKFKGVNLAGEWIIAIEPMADVLARGQFGTKETITIKAGASAPETNRVTKPFKQEDYEQSLKRWTENLNKPEMKWLMFFNADQTGLHSLGGHLPLNRPQKHLPCDWRAVGYASFQARRFL